MTDYLRGARFPLPDDWSPEGYLCVKVTIPDDPQYLAILTGLLDELRQSRNFARDTTGTGAATVARTFDRALNQRPVESEDCELVQFRINPESCLLEVNCSTDPEAPDWQTVITPATDPRTDIKYPVPYPDAPPEGQTNECLAASNAASWVWIACGGWAGQLGSGTFAEFTVLVMGVIGGLFTLLTDIIIDNTTTLFTDIEPSTIEADFALLDVQELVNILVCYLAEDGTMPVGNWGNFLDDLLSRTGDNQAWYLIHYCFLLVGWGGFNLIARIGGILDADCAECDECGEWEHFIDFELSNGGFEAFVSSAPLATYEGGVGWRSVYNTGGYGYTDLQIYRDLPDTFITKVTYTYESDEIGDTPYMLYGGTFTLPYEPDAPQDYLRTAIGSVGAGEFTKIIKTMTICGNGTNPFA